MKSQRPAPPRGENGEAATLKSSPLNEPSTTKAEETYWQVANGQQQLGVFTQPQACALAAAGTLPPACLLSCGNGWLTLPEFMLEQGVMIASPPRSGVSQTPSPVGPRSVPIGAAAAHLTSIPLPAGIPQGPTSAPQHAPAPAPIPQDAPTEDASHRQQPAQAPLPPQAEPSGPPERDRIVVLGRRQSGKTIYLASVYSKLWRALDGLTAKALRGEVHKQLMDVGHLLRQGAWPASTLESRQMELELEEGGKRRLMVALDYAGEMFANAFLHERLDMPDVKTLVDHIDRAVAVMLLVDPSIVAGMDHQAATEDDFGLVQAVQRIRNWPGGDEVPIVLVLTKIDQHQALLDRFGGPDGFVRHHFPALVRLLKRVPIFQVSAVQVKPGTDGKPVPRRDSSPINVDNPLRYCLRKIHEAEEKLDAERGAQDRRLLEARLRREEMRRERRQNAMLITAITGIILVGIVVVVLILIASR